MNVPVSKQEVIEKIEAIRSQWNEVIASLTTEQCLRLNTCGHWSVKDVVAHLSWFEQQMEWMVTRHSMIGKDTEWWLLPTDERNAKIHALYEDLSLGEVKMMAQERYARMLKAIGQLADADFTDPSRYDGMPSDWVPADIIAQNTWEHYTDHLVDIRKAFGV
jgi:hypothetical protein